MDANKSQLIKDIQQLLNTHEGIHKTSINPDILEFMDEDTLKGIIDSLLTQKEDAQEADVEWLSQFKKDID